MSGQNELKELYAKVEDICKKLKDIRGEAASIVEGSGMPDATLHLHDILKSSEQATMTILDAATSIGGSIENDKVPADVKHKVGDEVGKIYEACSFQDINGQRVKKVLEQIEELEDQLQRLADKGRGNEQAPLKKKKDKDPLLNGPQLSGDAPSQADIDKLFGS